MRRISMTAGLVLLGGLALLTLDYAYSHTSGAAHAQSSLAEYAIDWFTIDGGGAIMSSGGPYTLGGTIGQPDPGAMSNGSLTLGGGFWAGAEARYTVALPLAAKP